MGRGLPPARRLRHRTLRTAGGIVPPPVERTRRGARRCGDLGAAAFGVRRPLRFLAYKLELDDQQIGELARILNALKTERAQAEVDARRAMAGLADAVAATTFDHQVATDAPSTDLGRGLRLGIAVLVAGLRSRTTATCRVASASRTGPARGNPFEG